MQISTWLASCHRRIFPTGNHPEKDWIQLHAAKGEQVSFQAVIHYGGEADALSVTVSTNSNPPLPIRIRSVGFVPVPHHNTGVSEEELDGIGHIPGYVPDPLYNQTAIRIGSKETGAFWFTVNVPVDHPAGRTVITISIEPDKDEVSHLECELFVQDCVLERRKGFAVSHWFYNDAILDWYRLQPFEEQYWRVVERYIENVVEHGQDTLYVPLITPPLDGVKRPTQLLQIHKSENQKNSGKSKRAYRFNWHSVKQYIDLARSKGIQHFEWAHLFTQWGCRYAPRMYRGQGEGEVLLWEPETPAVGDTYRSFLKELLPEWKNFLQSESLEDRSFFHVSDEPGAKDVESYRKARDMLKELAPWMKTMDAVSELVFAKEQLTDVPIPSIQTTKAFVEDGQACWTYFCCGPRGRYLNRLMDTPLIKIRMAGWLFYKFGVLGFLHWGYNYWYKSQTRQLIDPYLESSGLAWPGWAYGDTFVVYPGEKGPVDSIRWEVFAESLQDLALLQQAEREAGFSRDSQLLSVIEDFDCFPKSEKWWSKARKKIFATLESSKR